MKTPLGRVRGFGSAKSGTEHFIRQRLTAISNLVLLTLTVLIVVSMVGDTHAEVLATLSRPWIALILLAAVLSVTYHMRIGVQVVIEDYVHSDGLKIASLIGNLFFSLLIALVSAFALLKIAFGG